MFLLIIEILLVSLNMLFMDVAVLVTAAHCIVAVTLYLLMLMLLLILLILLSSEISADCIVAAALVSGMLSVFNPLVFRRSI